jgi:hypothetical protein
MYFENFFFNNKIMSMIESILLKELNMNTKVKSLNGKEFSALNIFSYSLKWIKETVLNELNDQLIEKIQNDNIKWILTVPAIWKAKSKYFMREAAYEAGLISRDYPDQLLIALEPETASIYIRQLRKYQLIPDEDFLKRLHDFKLNINELKPDLTQVGTIMGSGTRYIVIFCCYWCFIFYMNLIYVQNKGS